MPDSTHIEAILTLKAYAAKIGRQDDPTPKVQITFVASDLDTVSPIQWQLGREIKVIMEPYQPTLPIEPDAPHRVTTVDGEGTVVNTELFGSSPEELPEPSGEVVPNGITHDTPEGGDWRAATGLSDGVPDAEHESQEPAELAPRAGRRRGTRAAVAVEEPAAE